MTDQVNLQKTTLLMSYKETRLSDSQLSFVSITESVTRICVTAIWTHAIIKQ